MPHRRYSIHSLFQCFLFPSYLLFAFIFLHFNPPPTHIVHRTKHNTFSLTAYIPLSSHSFRSLNILLEPFTSTAAPHIHQLVFLCPSDLFDEYHSLLSLLIDQETQFHPGVQLNYVLRSIPATTDLRSGILAQASEAITDWVLILDENGIDDISEPSLLALRDETFFPGTSLDIHGPIFPLQTNQSTRQVHFDYWQDSHVLQPPLLLETSRLVATIPSKDTIAFLFPSIEALRSASKMICGLLAQDYIPRVLIYDRSHLSSSISWQTLALTFTTCQRNLTIHQTVSRGKLSLLSWLSRPPKILFLVSEDKFRLDGLFSTLQHADTTRIYIPTSQYSYTDWIGSLSIPQLQHWHTPEIMLSIITQNRPHSLQRLLHSLTSSSGGLYFGDNNIHMRINIDHPSDPETKCLAQNFSWQYGPLQIHQRIVHGGLLPAIVESWYPHSNDSYGLLLEDDIELSPLFYAWIKMTILKYRYGPQSDDNSSPNLYGISLYQQKHLELPLSGRQPFNPRTLFSSQSEYHTPIPTNIPYLSSIPCSWGAIYFPEHWREFHEYLSHRLASPSSKGAEKIAIVPNVRSTRWARSWKKFFIELVYLRGYVMLYPNFANFSSLSTNHLEIGSHVRARASPEKKDLFLLPLLQLPSRPPTPFNLSIKDVDCQSVPTGLLDLPNERLPPFQDLPVLNLTGSLTSLDSLIKIGQERGSELFSEI